MAESKLTITAEEIYIFLNEQKLYFGQIIKAILMHLQERKFIFCTSKRRYFQFDCKALIFQQWISAIIRI